MNSLNSDERTTTAGVDARVLHAVLTDPALSAKAKGVYAYLAVTAPDGPTSTERVTAAMRDGISAVRAAIRELETHGVLTRTVAHDAAGRVTGMVYTIGGAR